MAEYKEFPKTMNHPAHQSARQIRPFIPATPNNPVQLEEWQGERYPAVIVHDADAEAWHAAKGYVPAGTSDPKAFSAAHASPYVAGRTTSEWPKMLDGKLVQDPNAPKGGPAEYPKWVNLPNGNAIVAQSEEEEKRLFAQAKYAVEPGNQPIEEDERDEQVIAKPKRRGRPPRKAKLIEQSEASSG
jgi:hypothetical protein